MITATPPSTAYCVLGVTIVREARRAGNTLASSVGAGFRFYAIAEYHN